MRDNGIASGYADLDSSTPGDEGYTLTKQSDYDGTTQKVCMDFEKPDEYDYEKGIYRVNVYSDGYDIGGGSFEVK